MKYTPARSFAAKSIAAGVAAVTFASAGVALAASGNLPSDGQEDPWGNGWGFGLQKDEAEEIEPVEEETPEEEVTDEDVTDEDVTDEEVVEEEITDEIPAAFNGHCRAFSVGNKDTNGKALEAPPFVALIEAAGGVENVEAYCTALFADETDTDSGDDEAKKAKKVKKVKKDRPEHPGDGNGSGPGVGGGSGDDGSGDESGDEGSETDTP